MVHPLPPRRVATAPVTRSHSTSPSRASPSSQAEPLVETLYNHPSVKITAFTSSQRVSLATGLPSQDDEQPGTLPASSRMERTIAVGPFRIYRAPGSVAFLNCGSALQPILPKSQCWCITEDNARFVLQIRRPQYWRIELPVSAPDEIERALLLRDVFDKILLFEKTHCPFQRTFTVDLPEEPSTPVKKKAWTAEGKNLIASAFSSDLPAPADAPLIVRKVRQSPSPSRRQGYEERLSDNSADELSNDHQVPQGEGVPGNVSPGPPKVSVLVSTIQDNIERDRANGETDSRGTATSTVTPADQPNWDHPPKSIACLDRSTCSSLPCLEQLQEGACMEEERARAEDFGLSPTSEAQSPVHERASEGNIDHKAIPFAPIAPAIMKMPRVYVQEAKKPVTEPADDYHTISTRTGPPPMPSFKIPDIITTDESLDQSPTRIIAKVMESKAANKKKDADVFGSSDEDDPSSFEGSGRMTSALNLTRKRKSRIVAGRTWTAPPRLTLQTSPPSKSQGLQNNKTSTTSPVESLRQQTGGISKPPPPTESSQSLLPSASAGDDSPVESMDSFHSVQSWHSATTPLPPSPPSSRPVTPSYVTFPPPHENIVVKRRGSRSRDINSLTDTPRTDHTFVPSSAGATIRDSETISPQPRSPVCRPDEEIAVARTDKLADVSRASGVEERPPARHRAREKNLSINRRALSPLPPAANLFSPPASQPSQGRLASVRRLPSVIIHKTVEILLSPPSHLVNLMLQVAAKITAGEWQGAVSGVDEHGTKIPVRWDYSDDEFSDWEEDDEYAFGQGEGIQKLASHETNSRRASAYLDSNQSWEMD